MHKIQCSVPNCDCMNTYTTSEVEDNVHWKHQLNLLLKDVQLNKVGAFEAVENFITTLITPKPTPEVEELEKILEGIDKTENDSDNGWWETSGGADFGTKKLSELKSFITTLTTKHQTEKEILTQALLKAGADQVEEEVKKAVEAERERIERLVLSTFPASSENYAAIEKLRVLISPPHQDR